MEMNMRLLRRILNGPNGARRHNSAAAPGKTFNPGSPGPVYSSTKIVSVPVETLTRNRIVLEEETHVAEQFKILRTRLLSLTRPHGWSTIQVTGFEPGEGKSLIAANLAISLARDSRQTTLLVDLDFRNPSIHAMLGLEPKPPGLSSFFSGEKGLEEILINPGIERLTILPGGRIMQAAELIGSSKMEALVAELKERYKDRYIIFDTPPLNGFPDAMVFSEYVDSVVLVARAGFTSRTSVESALNLIPRDKILGVVFNDVSQKDLTDKYYKYYRGF